MPSVLFVCTANRCRSPMAVALLRQHLAVAGVEQDWHVESAGTWVDEGRPAARMAEQVMHERALTISAHRARAITHELACMFDVILVMEAGHREALCVEFPDLESRIYRLSEMAGHTYDIPDPIAGPLSEVRAVAHEIDALVQHAWACMTRHGGHAADTTRATFGQQ